MKAVAGCTVKNWEFTWLHADCRGLHWHSKSFGKLSWHSTIQMPPVSGTYGWPVSGGYTWQKPKCDGVWGC